MRVTVVTLLFLGVLPCMAQKPHSRQLSDYSQNLAPFVPSPQTIVNRMLEAAIVRPGELVYDLGCGDGRVLITAAQRFKARAVGVEISEPLYKSAVDNVKKLNLEEQVKVIHGNLLNVNLNPADVVVIYLETLSNDLVRPNLEKYLKPGARVVSHDFQVRGWKPNRIEKIDFYNRPHTIYVYEMPPTKK